MGSPFTLVEKNDIPQQCFCHMPVDLVVPMPTSCAGDWYFLTVLDPSTRWFDYISLLDITEEPVLEAFILGWVIHFSMPSDWGALFTSGMWTTWCQDLQVEHITTTAFSPPGKQMVEVLCHQPKEALHAR